MNSETKCSKQEGNYMYIKSEPISSLSEQASELEVTNHFANTDWLGCTVPIEYLKSSCVKNEPPDDAENTLSAEVQETKNGEVWIPVSSSNQNVAVKCEPMDDKPATFSMEQVHLQQESNNVQEFDSKKGLCSKIDSHCKSESEKDRGKDGSENTTDDPCSTNQDSLPRECKRVIPTSDQEKKAHAEHPEKCGQKLKGGKNNRTQTETEEERKSRQAANSRAYRERKRRFIEEWTSMTQTRRSMQTQQSNRKAANSKADRERLKGFREGVLSQRATSFDTSLYEKRDPVVNENKKTEQTRKRIGAVDPIQQQSEAHGSQEGGMSDRFGQITDHTESAINKYTDSDKTESQLHFNEQYESRTQADAYEIYYRTWTENSLKVSKDDPEINQVDETSQSSTNQESGCEDDTQPSHNHSDLIMSTTLDDGKVQYFCKVCGMKYKCWRYIKRHICTHTGEKAFICDMCYKKFSRAHELSLHKLKDHTEEKPYLCNMCDSTFKRANDLNIHKRTHTGERPYQCDICDARFRTSTHLGKHRMVHNGDRPHVCETCRKTFKDSQALKRHARVHTGEKPYQCSVCDAKYTNYCSLRIHMQHHDGQKAYGCDVCGAKFSTSSYLKVHIRIHTGEKPFGCDTCGKRFSQKQVLKVHIRKHTGEKPFCCKVCDKRYAFSTSLKVHMRAHNGELR